jgi:hypothetical protein
MAMIMIVMQIMVHQPNNEDTPVNDNRQHIFFLLVNSELAISF